MTQLVEAVISEAMEMRCKGKFLVQ